MSGSADTNARTWSERTSPLDIWLLCGSHAGRTRSRTGGAKAVWSAVWRYLFTNEHLLFTVDGASGGDNLLRFRFPPTVSVPMTVFVVKCGHTMNANRQGEQS